MAKLKMLRYPKKPKASASVSVKENYLRKVSDIDKENRHRESLNKKSDALTKKISGIGSVTSRRKKSTSRRKR